MCELKLKKTNLLLTDIIKKLLPLQNNFSPCRGNPVPFSSLAQDMEYIDCHHHYTKILEQFSYSLTTKLKSTEKLTFTP